MQTADAIEARNAQGQEEFKQASPPAANSESNSEKWERLKPYQFKPGQSGNPNGRPKKDAAQDIARRIFENNPEAVYTALGKALLKGNAYAFKELAERAYGKLTEKRELTGANGGPVEFKEANESDINERIAQLERDLGLAAAIDDAGRAASTEAGTRPTNGKAEDHELLPR